jgi:hypothetical protein
MPSETRVFVDSVAEAFARQRLDEKFRQPRVKRHWLVTSMKRLVTAMRAGSDEGPLTSRRSA